MKKRTENRLVVVYRLIEDRLEWVASRTAPRDIRPLHRHPVLHVVYCAEPEVCSSDVDADDVEECSARAGEVIVDICCLCVIFSSLP